ncbi:hypothetical protein NUH86_20605 [Sphingobium sp. JS3065]|uniref:hypothetical protein n=1 Tax=Sphingobium sp. JS3065 TaxID=2970925 RepID=UPI002263FC12|nr:hypothetical protein [Sphingobium sp. JS3065]UZW57137.1 hypothetical protein NUH86_20605 [Sphingobium sp. JS3065]
MIPAIEERTGVTFDYVPVLLGGIFKATGNRSPVEAFAHIRNKPEYDKQELIDNTNAAVERGAFGSPTFFVNDDIYFGKRPNVGSRRSYLPGPGKTK